MDFLFLLQAATLLCKVSRLCRVMKIVSDYFLFSSNDLVRDKMHKASMSGDFEERVQIVRLFMPDAKLEVELIAHFPE